DCFFGKVREPFVQPRRLEVHDRGRDISVARVDHVLELVRNSAARYLPHERGAERVAVHAVRIRREQVKDLALVAGQTARRRGWVQITGEEESANVARL